VERVATAPVTEAAPALLDLLLLVRQARGGLATSDVPGELEPLPPSGPWATPAPVAGLHALYDIGVDGYRLDPDPVAGLQEASERGCAADRRPVDPFLGLLARGSGAMAQAVFTEVLPFFGEALRDDLLANRGRSAALLLAAYRADRRTALADAVRPAGRRGVP